MKVLFFSGYPYPFAGSQRSMALLARRLPAAGVEPLVFFPGEGSAVESCRAWGLRAEAVPVPRGLDAFEGALVDAPLARKAALFARGIVPYTARLARRMVAERVDVVHCNDSRAVLLAGWAARLTRRPVIWHLRGENLLRSRPLLNTLTHRLSTRIIAVAEALRAGTDPRVPATTIHNGIDPGEYAPSPAVEARMAEMLRERGMEGALRVVVTSSLLPFKGQHHLVEAVGRLAARRPELASRVALVVLGEPYLEPGRRYREYLGERARALGIESSVFWVGWQDDAFAWMAAGDVVALPTVLRETFRYPDGETVELECTEGFPRTLLEAMAAGRPALASDVAGVRELVVDGETGIVVPPGDPDALAEALERLGDAGLRARMGAAARERVERFSMDQYVGRVREVYRELVGGPAVPPA